MIGIEKECQLIRMKYYGHTLKTNKQSTQLPIDVDKFKVFFVVL
jgi:hypothetical protein